MLKHISKKIILCIIIIVQFSFSQHEIDSTSHTDFTKERAISFFYIKGGILFNGLSSLINHPIPLLGMGHFIQKDLPAFAGFLVTEASLIGLANNFQFEAGKTVYKIDSDNPSDRISLENRTTFANNSYANRALKFAKLISMIDFYSAYRGFHNKTAAINKVTFNDDGVFSLALSPFKPKYLLNPNVYVPIALGATIEYLSSKNHKSLSSAKNIMLFDKYYSPNNAVATFGAINVPNYLLVASGEEMFFRGAIQTELTEQYNSSIAIGTSSVLFGLYHYRDGPQKILLATLAGIYAGYRYEKNGYDLGETIAMHFWIDWINNMIEFYRNPREANFVFGINWKL